MAGGSRGPKPLPANVHQLGGNAAKRAVLELLGEFKPEVELPSFPAWLWPEAKKEWKRIGVELVRYGLVSKLDRTALVLYAQAWAKYAWAEQMLARDMKAAAEKRASFDQEREATSARGEKWTQGEWVGGDGFMIPTPNGSFTYSPYWVAARRAGEECDKYLASFGLSPSSRARVTQSDNFLGPYLPGLEPGGDNAGNAGEAQQQKPTLASFQR
jgi:P27 family predicted phage terminase small subunit